MKRSTLKRAIFESCENVVFAEPKIKTFLFPIILKTGSVPSKSFSRPKKNVHTVITAAPTLSDQCERTIEMKNAQFDPIVAIKITTCANEIVANNILCFALQKFLFFN